MRGATRKGSRPLQDASEPATIVGSCELDPWMDRGL